MRSGYRLIDTNPPRKKGRENESALKPWNESSGWVQSMIPKGSGGFLLF